MSSINKHVTTRKDGTTVVRWRARWREYPGGPQKIRHFDRKIDAERFLDGIRGDLVHGRYVDPDAGRITFDVFAEQWASGREWKGTTAQDWPYVLGRLSPLLGSMPLDTIDVLVLQRVQASLRAQYARSTVELTMSRARSIMKAAYASGRIGRDPTVGLVGPKRRADEPDDAVNPHDVPTRGEAVAILAGAPATFRAAIALGLAGLRVGEVLGLSVDRVDLEQRRVTIDRQLQRIGGENILTTPKAEKVRKITVPGVVAVELRRHMRDHSGDGLLFRGLRGAELRRDQFYASAWHPALLAAGLPKDRFVFHSLRHFAASSMLAEGAPLTAVAGHLGDSVETVSRTYAHWLRDDREVPAAVLDRVLAPTAAGRVGAL